MVDEDTLRRRKGLAVNRTRARQMRHEPVSLEKLFWSEVRNRKLCGYKFKRQYLIGRYIVDFVCVERKLVVELDGPFHAGRPDYDAARDGFLSAHGYTVLRFGNEYTAAELAIVLATVKHALAPSPRPSPPAGEREKHFSRLPLDPSTPRPHVTAAVFPGRP